MAIFRDDEATSSFSIDTIDTPQSRRVESSVLVDLRGSPRIEVSFPVQVTPHSGPAVLGMITNISRTGLRAEGDRNLVEALFDGEVRLERGDKITLIGTREDVEKAKAKLDPAGTAHKEPK